MSWSDLIHVRMIDALTLVGFGCWVGGYISGSQSGLEGIAIGLLPALLLGGAAIYLLPSAEEIAVGYWEETELEEGEV